MPLQNRCLPDGTIVAQSWRGDMMGNRGGRFHDVETQSLRRRRWHSKRWIICLTSFKNRQRKVMGKGYTELFFLDEVSALAAGHRPCFECQRDKANAFADIWCQAFGDIKGGRADIIDRQLHAERTTPGRHLLREEIPNFPDGTVFSCEQGFFTKRGNTLMMWNGDGYREISPDAESLVLVTPPSILEVLRCGYQPDWHDTARSTGA